MDGSARVARFSLGGAASETLKELHHILIMICPSGLEVSEIFRNKVVLRKGAVFRKNFDLPKQSADSNHLDLFETMIIFRNQNLFRNMSTQQKPLKQTNVFEWRWTSLKCVDESRFAPFGMLFTLQ
jgi:hypothetical protein